MADHRAVPDSYLHVEINEAAIDWIGGGANYAQVLSGGGDDSAPMTLLLDDGRGSRVRGWPGAGSRRQAGRR